MEKENTIKESISFCLFGTSEQRKISLDLIEKCLAEKGIDISKCESKKASTSDEALPIAIVGETCGNKPTATEMRTEVLSNPLWECRDGLYRHFKWGWKNLDEAYKIVTS